jgi:hypothetical protein
MFFARLFDIFRCYPLGQKGGGLVAGVIYKCL